MVSVSSRLWRAAAPLTVLACFTAGGLTGCSPSRSSPPAASALALGGDISVHDPELVVTDDAWYVFSTGDLKKGNGAPQIRRSTDQGKTWEYVGTVWDADTRPEWAYDKVPLVTNFWAPDVTEHDGTYYLYYSASSFGVNTSVIGVATNTTLDPDDPGYRWVDRGEVIGSTPDVDDFNAIDPGVLTAEDGTPWMTFGSFWGGIQLIQLRWPSGKPAVGVKPKRIAIRDSGTNPIEAPIIVRHGAHYYLFVSRDYCCKGKDSTYQIAVGRSPTITGPYVDQDGRDLAEGGGTVLLTSDGDMIGPGGQSYDDGYLAFHYYDGAADGAATLAIRQVLWGDAGWPVLRTAEELETP
jgi:arabinan endo-1,5-alpha-L-arabinosidase